MSDPNANTLPVVFIHGLWIHSSAWAPWIDLFDGSRLRRQRAGLARATPTPSRRRARTRSRSTTSASSRSATTTPTSSSDAGQAHRDRPLLRRAHRAGAARQRPTRSPPSRSTRRPIKGVKTLPFSQLRSGFPVLGNPANKKRTVVADRQAVPLQLRQRDHRRGIRRPVRGVDDPRPRPAAVRGRDRQLLRNSPAAVDTHLAVRGPLLLTSAPRTTPCRKVTLEVLKLYADNPSRSPSTTSSRAAATRSPSTPAGATSRMSPSSGSPRRNRSWSARRLSDRPLHLADRQPDPDRGALTDLADHVGRAAVRR